MNGDQLVGTWKIVSLKTTSGGKASYPLRPTPEGFATLTAPRLWVLFVDSARQRPGSSTLTDADAIAAMKSHVGWTGTYTLEDHTDGWKLTSRVDAASSHALTGTERVYFMRVDGDRLTMKSPGSIVPMTGGTSVIEVELVRAN